MTANILYIILIFEFTLSIVLGIFVISKKPGNLVKILFLIMIIIIAIVDFSAALIISSTDINSVFFWYRISAIGILLMPIVLHIDLELLNINRITKICVMITTYGIYMFLAYNVINLNVGYNNFVRIGSLWYLIPIKNSLLNCLFLFLLVSGLLVNLIFLTKYYFKTKIKREKRQFLVLMVSNLCFLSFFFLEEVIFSSINQLRIQLTPVYLFVLVLGIAIAIIKYRFLFITPESISSEVIENMDEVLFVLDLKLDIILSNTAAGDFLSKKSIKSKIDRIIVEYNSMEIELKAILSGTKYYFRSNINFTNTEGKNILMAVKFLVLKDRFNDITGIMILARKVSGINDFKQKYRLTDREIEVIFLLITGIQNKVIAEKLSISESTVKSHIEHIYNKTTVNNKVELMNLLKEYYS